MYIFFREIIFTKIFVKVQFKKISSFLLNLGSVIKKVQVCFENLVPFFFNQKPIHIHNKYIDYSYYPIVPKLNDCYNCCSYNLKHLKKTKRQCTTPHHTKIFGHALFFKQRITMVYKLPKQTMLKISSFEIIIMKKVFTKS